MSAALIPANSRPTSVRSILELNGNMAMPRSAIMKAAIFFMGSVVVVDFLWQLRVVECDGLCGFWLS